MTILITNQGHNITTTGATVPLAVVANIVIGSSIVVGVNEDNTSGVVGTLTDDAGNTYTILSQASPNSVITSGRHSLWVCHNCRALNAGQNITYTKNTSGVAAIIAAGSISGGLFITDKVPTPTTGTLSPSISSGTLANSNEAVFAFLAIVATATDTFTQVSGFAVPFDNFVKSGGGIGVRGGSEVVSSTASVIYNPTITTGHPWSLQLATFQVSVTVTPKVIGLVSSEVVTKKVQIGKGVQPTPLGEIMSGSSLVTKNVTGKLSIHEGQQVQARKSINKVIIV